MILDLVDTRTNKLVFRGAGAAVIGGPESNAGKIRDAVKKRVTAAPSAATRGVPRHSACRFATFPRGFCPSGFQRNPLLGAENMQIARRLRAMIVNLADTLPAQRHPALHQELNLLDPE